MKLKIINSGSAGNCYILETETTALVLECGVKFQDIKQALDFNLRKVAGVLISHEHQDHCKSVKDVIAAGLNVYASYGTIKAMGITHSHRVRGMNSMEKLYIGAFSIMGFDVKHDCAEPFGFLINHPACGNVVFITDTYYVPHTFKNLNQVIVEANYCPQIVKQRMEANSIHGKVRDRVIESHMSIDTCLGLLKANDLSAVNNIVLIHLSDGNSNAAEFKQKVSDATGKTVHIAGKNMEIDLSKTPF
jgi:phosphoribosyl 1,2-cyclic phosphodiesterase